MYGVDAFYPGSVAHLGEVGFIRNQKVAVIELYPVQINPVSRQVRFHSQIQVELTFSHPIGRVVQDAIPQESSVFEQILRNQLSNYGDA